MRCSRASQYPPAQLSSTEASRSVIKGYACLGPFTTGTALTGLLVQVNAGSMAPITAIQFGAHRALDKAITTATGRHLEGLEGIGVAIGVKLS